MAKARSHRLSGVAGEGGEELPVRVAMAAGGRGGAGSFLRMRGEIRVFPQLYLQKESGLEKLELRKSCRVTWWARGQAAQDGTPPAIPFCMRMSYTRTAFRKIGRYTIYNMLSESLHMLIFNQENILPICLKYTQ